MWSGFVNGNFAGATEDYDFTIDNLPGVNRYSHILVTISEVTAPPGGADLDVAFLGGATMTVHNVVPQDNGSVIVRLSNNWNGPVNFRLWITVF